MKRSSTSGMLGINFDIFDQFGRKIAVVKNNVIYQGRKENYEIINQQDYYALLDVPNLRVICEVNRGTTAGVTELAVTATLFTPDSNLILFTPNEIRDTRTNNVIRNCRFENMPIGIMIGPEDYLPAAKKLVRDLKRS